MHGRQALPIIAAGEPLEAIERTDFLGGEQKQAIFHANAARFFELENTKPDGL